MELTLMSGEIISLDEGATRVWERTKKLAEALGKRGYVYYSSEYLLLALHFEAEDIILDFAEVTGVDFDKVAAAILVRIVDPPTIRSIPLRDENRDDGMTPVMRMVFTVAKQFAERESCEMVDVYHLTYGFLELAVDHRGEGSILTEQFNLPLELLIQRIRLLASLAMNTQSIKEYMKPKGNVSHFPSTGT